MSALQLISEKYQRKDNADILLQALKDFGGYGTVRDLNRFIWANPGKYSREGRAFSEHFVQHDLHYLMKQGRVIAFWDGSKCGRYVYYLSEKELWL